MSTDREVTRIVRSWLEDGLTELPDRVLDNVLDQLPATPQRRAWWPARRFRQMKVSARFAAAAVVVVVVVVSIGALGLLPRDAGVGTPSASPNPTSTLAPSALPTAVPSASSGPPSLPSSGRLEPGSYYLSSSVANPVGLAYTVPGGWSTFDRFLFKGESATPDYAGVQAADVRLITWGGTHINTDICDWDGPVMDAGSTEDELVAALRAQTGRVASAPTDVMVGGLSAKRIALTIPSDLDVTTCDAGYVRFFPDPGPDGSGGLCCAEAGSTDVVYVIESAGKRFAVVTSYKADTPAAAKAELDSVVASIRFDP